MMFAINYNLTQQDAFAYVLLINEIKHKPLFCQAL